MEVSIIPQFELHPSNNFAGKPKEYGEFILGEIKKHNKEAFEELKKHIGRIVYIDIDAVVGKPFYDVYTEPQKYRVNVDPFKVIRG